MCAIVTIDGREYATVRDVLLAMDVRVPIMAAGYEWWRCNHDACLCQINIEATAAANGWECRKDELGDYTLVRKGNHEPPPALPQELPPVRLDIPAPPPGHPPTHGMAGLMLKEMERTLNGLYVCPKTNTPLSRAASAASAPADCSRRVPDAVRHPSFDAEGYPTDETLETIRTWPHNQLAALREYVREAWSDYGRVWEEDGLLKFATGGWSGNESIIAALRDQRIFHMMYWESSHRGGLECFRVPKDDASSSPAGSR